jgi:O-antigen/teichoic acid export membrane protein
MVGPIGNIYQIFERTKINMLKSAIVAFGNIILNIILIPILGITGAAISTTLSLLAVSVIDLHFSRKLLKTHPFKKSILKIIASAGAATAITYLVNNLLFTNTPAWFYITDAIIFGAVYLLTLLYTNVLEEDDLKIIDASLEKYDESLIIQELEKRARSK